MCSGRCSGPGSIVRGVGGMNEVWKCNKDSIFIYIFGEYKHCRNWYNLILFLLAQQISSDAQIEAFWKQIETTLTIVNRKNAFTSLSS